MKKITLYVILLFSIIISSLFIFLSSPTNVSATHTFCNYSIGTPQNNGWFVQIRNEGSPGDYILTVTNQDKKTSSNFLFKQTNHGLKVFAIPSQLITGPGTYAATTKKVGGTQCGLATGKTNIWVVTGSNPDPGVVPSDCNMTADPKVITNIERDTMVVVTDLKASTKYFFDILGVGDEVNYYTVEAAADGGGRASFRVTSAFFKAPKDGIQEVVDLPEGDYTIQIRLAASGESTDPTQIVCIQQGVVFSVMFFNFGEAGGDEVITDLPSQINTPLGTIDTTPEGLARAVLSLGVGAGGGIAFLMMVFGAYRLMFAGGNPESIQEGRQVITSAIVGLIVVILAIFLLDLIGVSILGLDIL